MVIYIKRKIEMKPTLFFELSRTGHLLMSISDPECIPNIGDIVVIEGDHHKIMDKIINLKRGNDGRGYIGSITYKVMYKAEHEL